MLAAARRCVPTKPSWRRWLCWIEGPQQRQPKRGISSSLSSTQAAAAAAGYSSSWRTVDSDDNDDDVAPPVPLQYLQGFDAVPAVQDFKRELFRARDLHTGDHILDVGCGTATHPTAYLDAVGPTGHVTAVDNSAEMIDRARQVYQSTNHLDKNLSLDVANIYELPFSAHTFDTVKEDRVLEHLHRPLEAVHELRRVCKPGGVVVVSNPDFRSFQLDTIRPQQRWNDPRRPPADDGLDFDLFQATAQVFRGVIPTLATHTDMGLSQPRLLKAAGLRDIELKVQPIPLLGRQAMEAVMPLTFMAQCSVQNGAITADEMHRWLQRLEWEGDDNLYGVLNMYICRGVKPTDEPNSQSVRERSALGTRFFPGWSPAPQYDTIRTKITPADATDELIQQLTTIINDAYNVSDTGITLRSERVQFHHVQEMVQRGEILMALEETTNELLGCLQLEIKTADASSGNPNSKGYALDEGEERLAEFTCFATVPRPKNDDGKAPRRGVGAALVRAAEQAARSQECPRMQIAILCPADYEPEYKQWLQSYYLKLGYEHKRVHYLGFEQDPESGQVTYDELHEKFDPLHQLIPCKAIIMEKILMERQISPPLSSNTKLSDTTSPFSSSSTRRTSAFQRNGNQQQRYASFHSSVAAAQASSPFDKTPSNTTSRTSSSVKGKKQRTFVPRKAAVELTESARTFFQKLLANPPRPDIIGIQLCYSQSSTGQPRMVFSFRFVSSADVGDMDEGVSLEVLKDGTTPKPPAEAAQDGLPKLYVQADAFLKVLGAKVDVDQATITPILYDKEGNKMDPNA